MDSGKVCYEEGGEICYNKEGKVWYNELTMRNTILFVDVLRRAKGNYCKASVNNEADESNQKSELTLEV